MIDPDVSPIRLIKNSDLSISIPFTSSPLYAREMGKKTIYYDSQKIISKKNIASHGLEIILGKEELRNWIDKIDFFTPSFVDFADGDLTPNKHPSKKKNEEFAQLLYDNLESII